MANISNGKERKSGSIKGAKGDPVKPSRGSGPEGARSSGAGLPPQPDTARAEAAPAEAGEPSAVTSGISVVGLGGSAGALDCFKTFFEAMPADSGAAFVVLQHLAPTYTSLLAELLAQHTRMTVAQAEDGVPVQPNCVYVIPPNQYLGIRDGILFLTEPVKRGGIRLPIDFFFRSLAEDQQERAVCVVFSGAGSDGTLGVRAIRGSGGLAIAQDPQTAQYGDMPRSAIATKLVDYVLPPDQMPGAITEYLRQPYVRDDERAAVLEAQEKPGSLNEVLAIVQAQTACDFRCYKKGTILRRIERRMGLRRISDMAKYSQLLRDDAGEVTQLYKDMLINVTAFFRDAEAFEELRLNAIRPMVEAKAPDKALRVWVPGCSSGEEAYSLAMLLMEEMTAAGKSCPMQVFATDIDEEALEFARHGIYPESIVADVGIERLGRFFVRKEQGYQVSESLRNSVVFATQNLITDPPFSKMDLLSCRNLLIYLDGETQLKLVPLFNFALNSGGYLFLGKSEGLPGQNDLFSPVAKQAKLYRRCAPGRPVVLDTPILPGRKRTFPPGPAAIKPPAAYYADAIRQVLLSHFSAGIVLVDRKGQILQFYGQTGKYLNMPTAEPSLNLLDTAKAGLALPLRSALRTALDQGKSVVQDQVPITREQGAPFARITVAPLARHNDAEPLLAVIFEDIPRPAMTGAQPVHSGESEAAIRQLEDELRSTEQELQSSIEELQSANEELHVSNEEVVSTNEELQSTNEELETSKEELQSINEELTTVNSQLQEKVERLDVAHSDMANLLKSTQIGALFLDSELRIKFFTPPATRILKLIPSDMGRPLGDLSTNFLDYDLTGDARAVAQGGSAVERDVRHADGSSYVVRVMPYLAKEDRVEGVVVTFTNVARLRLAEERARRLATVVTDSNDAVILFDLDGRIQEWNRGAQGLYGWSEEEALRMNISDLAPQEEEAAGLADLRRRLAAGESIASYETKRRGKDGRVLDVWLTITVVLDESKKVVAIATTERDVTERKRAEEALRERARFRQAVLDGLPARVAVLDAAGVVIAVNRRWEELEIGSNYLDFFRQAAVSGEASAVEAVTCIESVLKGGKLEAHAEYPCDTPTGQQWFLVQAVHDAEQIGGVIISHVDITARRQAEESLAAATQDLTRSNEDLQQFAYVASHDLQEPLRMVGGFLRLLEERYKPQLDDRAKEYIGYAVDGAERMSQLISDLLVYSRVGRKDAKLERVDANRSVTAALANLRGSIQEAGATVTHDELPSVIADESQLTQVFQNLIGNALKFRRPDRPCQVHVGAEKKGKLWVLSIRDNGIGIDSTQAERIFVIFQRLHTRDKYEGTGIGLAICKKIVERHGGRIWVESRAGEGATFYFTLPANL